MFAVGLAGEVVGEEGEVHGVRRCFYVKNAAEAAFLAAGWSAVGDFDRHPAFFAYHGVNQVV